MITSSAERIRQYEISGLWEGLTLHQLLTQRAADTPVRQAIVDPPNRADLTGHQPLSLTFQELEDASTALAVDWLRRGVGTCDRVIVQLPNIVELAVCYFAASKLGAVISPVPVQYGRHELQHINGTLNARLYVSIDNLKGKPFAAEQIRAFDNLAMVMTFFGEDQLQLTATEQDRKTLRNYQNQYASQGANQILSICWTSGTTGMPKGVPRSHNMWVTVARNCIEAGDYRSGERLLNPFPLVNMASIASFLYPCVLLGCSVVLHHPFEAEIFLQQIQNEKINFTIAPPAVLNQLAKNESLWSQFDFSSLRAIGSGSAPLSPSMIEVFDNRYEKKIINFYGSNEGISLFCRPCDAEDATTRAQLFPRFGAPGVAWDVAAANTISTKVMCPSSGAEISSAGSIGELLVKGPGVFDGYYDSDNSNVFVHGDYFMTGDLVEICGADNRYYRIVGRSKDIINRGGIKLSPTEVDTLLEDLPGAKEAVVCAYPDDALGERICACIVPALNAKPPTLDDVVSHLAAQGLATVKMPERLVSLTALPRNPLGKVQRFMLQQHIARIHS